MIPFVAIDEAKVAPLHPFGVCCALAFFAWDYVVMKIAVRRGLDRADFRTLTIVAGVFGWMFAWLVDAVFYHPGESFATRFGAMGLSSTGSIVGATIGAVFWSRVRIANDGDGWRIGRRATPVVLLPVADVILGTWPVAFSIGRLGCALIHDHVGKSVAPGTIGSLFAVGFPRSVEDGVHQVLGPVHVITGGSDLRFDLGLLEMLVLGVLALAFASTWRRDLAVGTYTIASTLVYGPLRFVLDFLRAEDGPTGDARHGGLTFAQYWALAVIGLGVYLLVRRRGRPETPIGVVPPRDERSRATPAREP